MTTTADVLGYREWEAEGRERYFVVSALATARDVERVKRDFKPLNSAWCERIWKSLFPGLKRAFDTGWPHEAICRKFTNPAIRDPSVHVRADSMRNALDWPDDQIVYLVNDSRQVYECNFGDFVRHYRGEYLDLSHRYAICHPDDRRVIVFWSDWGPFFHKRGGRRFPRI